MNYRKTLLEVAGLLLWGLFALSILWNNLIAAVFVSFGFVFYISYLIEEKEEKPLP